MGKRPDIEKKTNYWSWVCYLLALHGNGSKRIVSGHAKQFEFRVQTDFPAPASDGELKSGTAVC
jgi:hypothetical protein